MRKEAQPPNLYDRFLQSPRSIRQKKAACKEVASIDGCDYKYHQVARRTIEHWGDLIDPIDRRQEEATFVCTQGKRLVVVEKTR